MPAIDVIKLEQHEGAQVKELNVLFAACGDLRNVITSVAGLPSDYTGVCNIIINDRDWDIVARSVIMLLVALQYEPHVAAEMILHLWYSPRITHDMFAKLQTGIAPLIEAVRTKMAQKAGTSAQSVVWTFGRCTINLAITNKHWDELPVHLKGCQGMTAEEAHIARRSVTFEKTREDFVESVLYSHPPGWRAPVMKMREDGMLLPFGASREAFEAPNPTIFSKDKTWPQRGETDAFRGWSYAKVLEKAGTNSNDIYGALNRYITDLIRTFCERIRHVRLNFTVYDIDAVNLPRTMAMHGKVKSGFDSIEFSNIVDAGYVGAACFELFGPLLRPKLLNEHAMIIGCYMNAIPEVMTPDDRNTNFEEDLARYVRYLPMPALRAIRTGDNTDVDNLRFWKMRMEFMDFDAIWDRYDTRRGVDMQAFMAGLEMKKVNTIVKKWPMRLEKDATQEEFQHFIASNAPGSARYCEWVRIGRKVDVDEFSARIDAAARKMKALGMMP